MKASNYKVTEKTANVLDALRTLDRGCDGILAAMDETYGSSSSDEMTKDFTEKYQTMKEAAEQLLLLVMMDNFAPIDSREI